jgi:hypothetical protein
MHFPNIDLSELRRALDRLERQTFDVAMARAAGQPALAAVLLGVAPVPTPRQDARP